jgi:hypothetical protein
MSKIIKFPKKEKSYRFEDKTAYIFQGFCILRNHRTGEERRIETPRGGFIDEMEVGNEV